MQSVRWIGIALIMVTGCPKSGVERELGGAAAEVLPHADGAEAKPARAAEAVAPLLAQVTPEHFQRSYDHEAAGKDAVALADLDGVAGEGHAKYVLELRRGWLLARLGKYEAAAEAYGRAGALAPRAVEAKLGALAPLAALGRFAEVEAVAKWVATREPGSYAATLRGAFAAYSQKKLAQAEASYRALSERAPSDVEARAGLAWTLLDLGRQDEARVAFADILAVAPKHALAQKGAAALGGVEPAESSAAFARSYDDEANGKSDVALADLAAVRATGNAEYVLELRRAWLLYRTGKHAESVAAYARASQRAPASVEAKVGALAPLAMLRRWASVETMAKDVLAKDPGSYAPTIRLAFALYSQAKLAEAEAAYRALTVAYPSDVDALAGLGWTLLKARKNADAAAAFREVLAVAPKNALALEGMTVLKK